MKQSYYSCVIFARGTSEVQNQFRYNWSLYHLILTHVSGPREQGRGDSDLSTGKKHLVPSQKIESSLWSINTFSYKDNYITDLYLCYEKRKQNSYFTTKSIVPRYMSTVFSFCNNILVLNKLDTGVQNSHIYEVFQCWWRHCLHCTEAALTDYSLVVP